MPDAREEVLEWVLRAGEGVPADENDDVLCCPASPHPPLLEFRSSFIVCGTMRSMCGAGAGCLAINYQSLSSFIGLVLSSNCGALQRRGGVT